MNRNILEKRTVLPKTTIQRISLCRYHRFIPECVIVVHYRSSYRNHRSIKRAWHVAEKHPTFKHLRIELLTDFFLWGSFFTIQKSAARFLLLPKCFDCLVLKINLFVRVYQLISNDSVNKLVSPLTTSVYYYFLRHRRQNSTKEVSRTSVSESQFWRESGISFALFVLNNRLSRLTKLMCGCNFLLIFISRASNEERIL